MEHLTAHRLISDSQHGFLRGRSCLTNLLTYLELVTKTVDDGNPVDAVYLDFSKAFDRVPHQRLLTKLRSHGIGDSTAAWIKAWLSDRQQRVVVNGAQSEWSGVKSGVPQGSVLGPLLFIIYINDIDEDILSLVLKFADDTKVFRKVKTPADARALQDDLDRLYRWSDDWQMLFNIDKCKCLHFGHRKTSSTTELLHW